MTPYFVLLAVVSFLTLSSSTVARIASTADSSRNRVKGIERDRKLPGNLKQKALTTSPKDVSRPCAKRLNLFDFLAVALLIGFSAVRYGVGTDFFLYTRLYGLIDSNSFSSSIENSPQEAGYTTLSFLLRQFTDSSAPLFWVTSILAVVPVYFVIRRVSSNHPLAVFLYIALAFYLTPLNVMRQGVAVALNFYAVQHIDKHKIRFFILNGLAASFHSSVIVVAILQYISRKWVPNWQLLMFVALTSFAGLVFFISGLFSTLVSSINPRYASYLNSESLAGGAGTSFVLVAHVLLVLFSLSMPTDPVTARYQVYSMLALPFFVVGFVSTPAARLEEYFSIFLVLAIPNQLSMMRDGRAFKVLLIAFSLVYMFAFLYSFGGLLPYSVRP